MDKRCKRNVHSIIFLRLKWNILLKLENILSERAGETGTEILSRTSIIFHIKAFFQIQNSFKVIGNLSCQNVTVSQKRPGQLLQLSEPENSIHNFDVRGMEIKCGFLNVKEAKWLSSTNRNVTFGPTLKSTVCVCVCAHDSARVCVCVCVSR